MMEFLASVIGEYGPRYTPLNYVRLGFTIFGCTTFAGDYNFFKNSLFFPLLTIICIINSVLNSLNGLYLFISISETMTGNCDR